MIVSIVLRKFQRGFEMFWDRVWPRPPQSDSNFFPLLTVDSKSGNLINAPRQIIYRLPPLPPTSLNSMTCIYLLVVLSSSWLAAVWLELNGEAGWRLAGWLAGPDFMDLRKISFIFINFSCFGKSGGQDA